MDRTGLPDAPADFFLDEFIHKNICLDLAKDMYDDSTLAKRVTEAYIEKYHKAGYSLPAHDKIVNEMMQLFTETRETANATLSTGGKIARVKYLPNYAIARILSEKNEWALVDMTEELEDARDKRGQNKFVVAKFETEGPDAGTWTPGDTWQEFRDFVENVHKYSVLADSGDMKMVFEIIKTFAQKNRKLKTDNPRYSAFRNGILDWKTKELLPFDPKFVFFVKSGIDLKKNAPEPKLTEHGETVPWTFDSWMDELTDGDMEMKNALYILLQAIVHPTVKWDAIIFFLNHTGNNGKGTFGKVCRNIAPQAFSMPFADLGKEFLPNEAMYSTVIISDENDAGETQTAKSEKVAKAIATGDIFSLNAKFKSPHDVRNRMLQIHMLNALIKFADTSNSLQRRVIFFLFKKCFTGCEKKWIKEEYLNRMDVLEWVVSHVVFDMEEATAIPRCKDHYEIMNDTINKNNTVAAFFDDFDYDFTWQFMPINMLYDAYALWYKDTNKSSNAGCYIKNSKAFAEDVKALCQSREDLEYVVRKRMSSKEFNNMDVNNTTIYDMMEAHRSKDFAGRDVYDNDAKSLATWIATDSDAKYVKLFNKQFSGVVFKNVATNPSERTIEDIEAERETLERLVQRQNGARSNFIVSRERTLAAEAEKIKNTGICKKDIMLSTAIRSNFAELTENIKHTENYCTLTA